MRNTREIVRQKWLLKRPHRAISESVGVSVGAVSLALMVDPYLLSGVSEPRIHSALPLMMFGTVGLFMYGLGFAPKTRAMRLIFHPVAAWLLFLAGAFALVGAA